MHVSLTPELENQVKLKVESGLYNNASEVVRESLRLMLERDAMQLRLRAEINLAYEQFARGEGIEVNSKEEFMALVRRSR